MGHKAGSGSCLARALLLGFLCFAASCQGDGDPIVEVTVNGLWNETQQLAFMGTLKGKDAQMPVETMLPGGDSVLYRIAIVAEQVSLDPGERAPVHLLVEAQGSDSCILASAVADLEVARGEVSHLSVSLIRESQKLCRVTVVKTGVAGGIVKSDVVGGSPGIDCGLGVKSCSARFPAGQGLTLRATPGPTAHRGGWSGPCTGRLAACQIPPLTGPIQVEVQFDVGVCTSPNFCWESPLPQGNTLRALSGIAQPPPDNVGWAVGDFGTILERKDGGWYGFWAGDSKLPVIQRLYGVAPGSSAAEAWAVGAAGTLLHWDGTSWASHPQSGILTTKDLLSTAALAPGQAWAVGAQGVLLQCGVSTCTPLANNDPMNRTLQRVISFAPKDAWAVGSQGVALRYDATGTWSPQTVPGLPPDLSSVWGANSSTLWAVGQGSVILRYNGTSWTPQNKPALGTAGFLGVWGADSQNLWAVGNGGLVARTVNGTDWSAVLLPDVGLSALYDVWGATKDEVVIVGQDGVVLRSQGSTFVPDGASFTPGSTSPADLSTREPVYAVSGAGPKAIWAVGQSGVILHWDGQRWQLEDNPDNERRDLFGVTASATDVWAVGKAGVALHRLVEGNGSWELLALPSRDTMNAVTQNSDGVLAVGAQGKIWRRALTGSSWISLQFRMENFYCAFGRGPELWIAGEPGGVNMTTIWRADNSVGMGWTAQTTPTAAPVRGLWGGADDGLWAAGDGMILRLDAGAATWNTSLSMAGATLLAIGGSASEVWAAGNGGLILQWSGTSWATVSSGTSNSLRGLWSSGPTELVVVGSGGTILRHAPLM